MTPSCSAASLAVRLIERADELPSLAGWWQQLAGEIPFRQWYWHASWRKHFSDPRSGFTLAVFDADRCVGLVPLVRKRQGPWCRHLTWSGSTGVCSDHQAILALPADQRAVAIAAADWLAEAAQSRAADDAAAWDLIEIDGWDQSDLGNRVFLRRLQDNGCAVHRRPTVGTWRIALPSDLQDYPGKLSKSSRRKIRAAMQQFDTGQFTVQWANSVSDLQSVWACLVELHQRRRTSLGDAGCFADLRFTRFLWDATTAAYRNGQLDLAAVWDGSRPVAAEIAFRGGRLAYAYQIGIDPGALKHNPGWLVNWALIRRAWADGLTHLDMCRGDSEYKQRLGAVPSECFRYRIAAPQIKARLLDTALTAGNLFKDWCRTGSDSPEVRW